MAPRVPGWVGADPPPGLEEGCLGLGRGRDRAPGLANLVRSPEHGRTAVPGGSQGDNADPRALTRRSHPGGRIRGSERDLSPRGLAILGRGIPGGRHGPQPDPALQGEDGKKGAERPASGRRPQAAPLPRHEKAQVTRPPARRPRSSRPAAGGARSQARPGAAGPGSRRAVGTHRHGHLGRRSRGPGGQRRRQAGRSGPPRRSEPPAPGPGALPAPRGILRAPGSRTVRPLQPAPRMRRAAPPLPLLSPPPGAALKARTPDPDIFLSAQSGDEAPSPPLTHSSGATSSRTISCAPAESGSQYPHPHVA